MTKKAIALATAVGLALFAWRVVGFMRVLPGHDFVGDLPYAEMLAASLREGRVFPDWIATETFGRPSTVQRSSTMLFLPPALLMLAGVGSIAAAKIWVAGLHVASIGAFYKLARTLNVGASAAGLGAVLYGLSRLHLQSFVVAGQWQLAVSFCLAPLLVREVLLVARDPHGPRPAVLAVLLAVSVLSDNERTVTLMPVLALVAAFALRDVPARRAAVTSLCGAFVVGVAISAAGTVPLLLERHWLALASDPALFGLRSSSQLSHPLFVIDSGNFLYGAEDVRPHGSYGVRASLLLVVGAVVGGIASLRSAPTEGASTPLRVWGPRLAAALVVALWCATARPAWLVSSFTLYPAGGARNVAIGAASVVVLVAGTVASFRAARSRWARWTIAAGGPLLALIPSSAVLSRLPITSAIQNPRWFLHVTGPLLASLLVAVALDAVVRGALRTTFIVRVAIGVGFVALGLTDHITNPRTQAVADGQLSTDARAAFAAMDHVAPVGRYLHVPYVESDAREAWMARETTRPSASAWLVWSSTRWSASALGRMHDELAKRPGAAIETLTAANVRFLLAPPAFRALDDLVARGALREVPSPGLRVLENVGLGADRFVTANDAPLAWMRDRGEVIVVPAARGRVRIAESYYPYWRARVNDRDVPVLEADGFMVVDVGDAPGRLELRYERPARDRSLLLLSAAGLVIAAALTRRRDGSSRRPA